MPEFEKLRLDFQSAGKAGRVKLLRDEGGCVDLATAARLFQGGKPVADLLEAVRSLRAIAVRDASNEFMFPVWQFSPSGGTLRGLDEVLAELQLRPGFSEITAFVFFLQHHPRTGGRPIDALRKGRLADVMAAAMGEHA